jgi:hypothetical protein
MEQQSKQDKKIVRLEDIGIFEEEDYFSEWVSILPTFAIPKIYGSITI